MSVKDIVFIAGSSNPELAEEIVQFLEIDKAKCTVKRFADGEIFCQVDEVLRGKDVFIVQSTSPPVNDSLMELLLMTSTCRRASAKRITAVVPYYGYARQDRKLHSRTPISAADVARLMDSMGVDRVVSVDLHCGQIQGFFPPRVPTDNLESHMVGLNYFLGQPALSDRRICIVSPDAGGVYRARRFQEGMITKGHTNTTLAVMIKHRARPNEIDRMDLVGDVKDTDAIIVDDIVDTAGTLCEAARQLKLNGASRVYAFITHGLLSGPALDRIEASVIEQLVITNTVKPLNHDRIKDCSKITVVSMGEVLAKAISRIQGKESLSDLFKKEKAVSA